MRYFFYNKEMYTKKYRKFTIISINIYITYILLGVLQVLSYNK